MGLLSGLKTYVGGAVDHDVDANKWRLWIIDILAKMDIKCYNPLTKPSWFHEFVHADPSEYYRGLEQGGELLDKTYEAMAEVRASCMAQVASSDFMICSLPKKFTFGTIMELELMDKMNKPVFFYCPGGCSSTWAFHQFSTPKTYKNVFHPTWESLIEYLYKIDRNEVELDPFQWISISYFKPDNIKWVKTCIK